MAAERKVLGISLRRKPDGWAKHIPAMGELAVLEGPWLSGAWYWRSDLERSQRSCWLVSEGYGSPPSPLCGYYPTERWVDHVCEVHVGTTTPVQGRIWAWKQP